MNSKLAYLIFYWLLYIGGLASYYYVFIDYGFGVTVMVTFVCGLGTILIANALEKRLLIVLGVLLCLSSLIFIGVKTLIEII
ncbi:hypothetical protein [Alkalibacillus salilacus]|uniref:Uncharacterized protein n=1 Tax=Alkalibacillus salilacus TaxID=284582 RepID=A0ABT9VIW7_9BACI|nr:hypothetical protein [Alkalibacillus salilacus]MDQ0160790.1 hypothetical protein [Alkalibacillus salilacus]